MTAKRPVDAGRYTLFVMLPWPFQLAALGFLALVWTAQWLDWQSALHDRHLNWHFGRRGAWYRKNSQSFPSYRQPQG